MTKNPLISIIAPCYNESEVFPLLKSGLLSFAKSISSKYDFEFVLVDDGSRDDTWNQISAFSSEDPRVKGVALSRNFGHQIALSSGYDLCQGDAVVSIDADLQDPLAVIKDMLDQWENGYEIVFAVRSEREGETWLKLVTARMFYKLFKSITRTDVPENSGDFRLMGRKSVEAFQKFSERHRYVRGMVGWLGFKTTKVFYHRHARAAGTTKYPLKKMLKFAVDSLISFSSMPLKLTYYLALASFIPIISYLVYSIFQFYAYGLELVPGWTSLIFSIAMFGFFTLISLGLLGEYVKRIYDEVKGRPLYFVRETLNR